ncbi:hypothetical protein PLICRDRAFT_48922 [Plicaturopsis crispa FD-325 SS-3]|nr:hypothetical protein PLICRDRAFT_48922 [Plicaturopsis crispa FD-325 SS-3]
MFSASFLALALPLLAAAAPTRLNKRAAADLVVLKFANVLEQLETTFYSQALSKFVETDFVSAGFSSAQIPIQQFTVIQSDESTHTSVLESAISALGDKALSTCQFDFSSVLTDVTTMAATARLVENVGVGAYLGGAALLTDPRLLNAAATILTVEARHQTMLNILGGGSAIPQAFDIPLTPPEVLAIAGGFISGCDTGITALPALKVTNSGPVTTGTQLSFSSSAINGSTDGMFCQMLAGGMFASISLPFSQCVVPPNLNGPVAIYVTSDAQPILSDVVDRASSSIVAGPTMAFIDIVTETITTVVRSSSGSSSGSSSSGSNSSSSGSSSSSSSSSATSTASSSASSPTASSDGSNSAASGSNNASAGPPPNMFTGVADGGAVTVNGWKNIPSGN